MLAVFSTGFYWLVGTTACCGIECIGCSLLGCPGSSRSKKGEGTWLAAALPSTQVYITASLPEGTRWVRLEAAICMRMEVYAALGAPVRIAPKPPRSDTIWVCVVVCGGVWVVMGCGCVWLLFVFQAFSFFFLSPRFFSSSACSSS